MQRLVSTIAVLAIAHLLAIAGAVIAAAVNIESIVVTGLPCTLLGIGVGVCGIVVRNQWLALLGFSTGGCSLAVFAWIFSLSWSPAQAQTPVTAALLGYELIVAPLASVGVYRLLAGSNGRTHWGQFNVRSLLLLMLLVGIDLAFVRAALQQRMPVLVVTAIGLGVASLLAAGVAVLWAQRPWSAQREAMPS